MNNEQFRKFISNKSTAKSSDVPAKEGAKAAVPALGSRLKAGIPMTPRNVKGPTTKSESARQAVTQKDSAKHASKTSVPKGTKLAAGYRDRTKERNDDEQDERATRIKALEESMKQGEIDEETFEKLRDEIVGGDASATHLVKGLDRRLLERIRRGEDISKAPATAPTEDAAPPKDIDDEFDDLENQDVAPIARKEKVKQGEVAPRKLTRDEIMAQFRASRAAAKPAPKQLSAGFRKIGQTKPQEGVRMEIDKQGREVMIITDADGNEKRKVRKGQALPGIDREAEVLGMEVADAPQAPQVALDRESDDDIFEGVPEYDPLAGLDDSDEEEEGEAVQATKIGITRKAASPIRSSRSPSPDPTNADPSGPASTTRNYFKDDLSTFSVLSNAHNPLSDPSVLANLTAKARQIDPSRFDSTAIPREEDEATRLKRKAAMLTGRDRDMDDIDMGFGANRGDDQDEMDVEEGGKRAKLSEWKGLAGDEDDEEDGNEKDKGGKKRKRGGGKKKGNKNDVNDVLRVMEAQKNR